MYEKYLVELGLGDKEAVLYLALLAVDSSSVADLAVRTNIKRPTVYVILGTLQKKGLVSETTVGKKTLYQAEPPERLETFVERQKVTLEEKARRLKDIIPELKATQKEAGNRPIVKYFEGRDGVISVMEEFFATDEAAKQDEKMYIVYSKDLLDGIFTDEERLKFKKIRVGKDIHSKSLYTYSKGEISSDSTGERIRLDEKKYPITCDIGIYEDKVRISILGEQVSGIFIKSKDFANTMKSLFGVIFDNKKN